MKYKKGLVSAIMPTYNRSEWIQPRVDELLNQTYKNWELVVVDDASTDNTQEVASELAKAHDNIKYIRLDENSGSVTIPRNVGILQCTGEFIAHTDDDVGMLPPKFSSLVAGLEEGDDNLAYGDRVDCHVGDPPSYRAIPPNPDWNPLVGWGVDGGQFMYRRSVYDSIDLCFVRRGCDWELAKRIWKLKEGFSYINAVISVYLWHGNNRSAATNDQETKAKPIYPSRYAKYFEGHDLPIEV